ncbi:MAG TPA: hypothetical protein VJU82_17445 [Acidobacteriaceae bacterium]|nr:hypothetical protein [Acidobacteriaceae bacterium]
MSIIEAASPAVVRHLGAEFWADCRRSSSFVRQGCPFVFGLTGLDVEAAVREGNGVEDGTVSAFDFVANPITVTSGSRHL